MLRTFVNIINRYKYRATEATRKMKLSRRNLWEKCEEEEGEG